MPPFSPRATPDEALLSAQAAGLRRLAFSIVRDADLAEDVVQDAYARALTAPAPAGPGLVGWLRVVVRGLARNKLRDDARRRARESAHTRERAAVEHVQDEERATTLRAVVDAVLALDEPDRRVVLARYFEGLDESAIAARDGLTVAGVATRLKRARAQLKARLEPRLGSRPGGVNGALALFAGLVRPRRAAWLASVPFVRVLFLHTKKVALAVALALVALVVWWITRPVGGPAVAWRPSAAETGAETPDASPSRAHESTAPRPDVVARARALEEASAASDETQAASAPEATASTAPKPPERAPHEFSATFEACDRDGHPMAGVRIVGAPLGTPLNELGFTDWRGRLDLGWRAFDTKSKWIVGARHPDEGRSALCEVELAHGAPNALRLVLRPPQVDKDYDVRAIEVALDPSEPAQESPDPRKRPKRPVEKQRGNTELDLPVFRLDEAGSGVFSDPLLLAPSGADVLVAPLKRPAEMQARSLAQTYRTARPGHAKRARADDEKESLEITRQELTALLNADVSRDPVTFELEIASVTGEPAALMPVSIALSRPLVRIVAATDERGRFVCVLPGSREVQLAYGGGRWPLAVERLTLSGPAARLRRSPEVAATFDVDLRRANGAAASACTVEIWSARPPFTFLGQAATGEDGIAHLGLASGAPWRVLARRNPAAIEIASLLHEAAYPGASPSLLSLPEDLGTGGLKVRFATSSGARPAKAEARLWDPKTGQALALFPLPREKADARRERSAAETERWIGFVSPLVRSGIYRLEAGAAGQRWASFGEVRVPKGGELDLGIVPFPESALLAIESAFPPPLPNADGSIATIEVTVELCIRRQGVLVRAPVRQLAAPQRIEIEPCEGDLTLTYRPPRKEQRDEMIERARDAMERARDASERTPAATAPPKSKADAERTRVEVFHVVCAPGKPATALIGATPRR